MDGPLIRTYAVSLGSLAMAMVIIRGAIHRELVSQVVLESVTVLVVFAIIGAFAGWITDHLICHNVEQMFRHRVDWYRQSIAEIETSTTKSKNTD